MKNIIFLLVILSVLLTASLLIAQEEVKKGEVHLEGGRHLNEIPIHSNRSLTPTEEKTIKTIIEDFQVNENAVLNGTSQYNPSIAIDGNGNFVICWSDLRNDDGSYNNADVYAQRYNSDGTTEGINFKVNDDAGSLSQYDPSIAIDDNGNFVICWTDKRSGDYDIYAQRYNSDGTAEGSNFKVNGEDSIIDCYYSAPSIAMDGTGNFVICWADERDIENFDIYAQRYNSDGTAEGSNFKVNDDGGSYIYQYDPSIAIDDTGNFVICWTDYRNGDSNIYAQRYNSDGIAEGSNFKVNNDWDSLDQYDPSIAIVGTGNFVICWIDERNGDTDIYAQRYNSDGTIEDSNFKVNDDVGSSSQYYPSIAIDGTGNFVICWEDYRNDDSDIYAQRYNSDGAVYDNNFRVTATGYKEQYAPDVALCNNSIYNTWHSNHSEGTSYDIWANVLDWDNLVDVFDEQEDREEEAHLEGEHHLQNYPNPFNPSTNISYELPVSCKVSLKIYSVNGELVKTLVDKEQSAGNYNVEWNGTNESGKYSSSGIYLYRLETDKGLNEIKKAILLK